MFFRRIKSPALWITACLLLLASIGLEWHGRACGFLFTSDSHQYLSAATSFSSSLNFLSPDGSYYNYWPPLFPIILSFFAQPLFALAIINIVCKVLLTMAFLHLANSFIRDSPLRIVFLTASMLSVHLAMISVFVWSELIFMALMFSNAVCALKATQSRLWFYCLLVTGFLLCLQRNAGLFWICGICLWQLLDTSLPLKKRIIESGTCFIICTSGLWAWNCYNTFYLQADFSFYQHDFFGYTFYNLKLLLATLGKMIVPLNTVTVVAGALFFSALLIHWVSKPDDRRALQFFIIVLVLYSAGFLAMPGQLDAFEMDRYFSVITPIVYLLIALMVQQKISSAKPFYRIIFCAVAFVWSAYPVTRAIANIQGWHERSCQVGLSESKKINDGGGRPGHVRAHGLVHLP